MSYQFMILADPEEGYEIVPNNVKFAYSQEQVEDYIRKVSSLYNQATICVYSLHSLAKVKRKPEYQRYVVKDGEIVPV